MIHHELNELVTEFLADATPEFIQDIIDHGIFNTTVDLTAFDQFHDSDVINAFNLICISRLNQLEISQ